MQSCGTLLSSAEKKMSLITGFNKHESRLLTILVTLFMINHPAGDTLSCPLVIYGVSAM